MEKNIFVSSSARAERPLFSIKVVSSHLRELGYPEKSIANMNRCQEPNGSFFYSYCDSCNYSHLSNMVYHCSLRTCTTCAKKRQRMVRRKYFDFLNHLPRSKLNRLYFLTISPKNYEKSKDGLIDIRKSFNKFLRSRYIKERIKGSLYVIESKQTWKGQRVFDKHGNLLYIAKEDSWNVHLHAIVYGRRLDNRIRGHCNCCGQNTMKFDRYTKKYYCANRRCSSKNVIVNEDSKLVTLWKKASGNQEVNFHISEQIDPKTRQPSPSYTLNYMLKYISADKEDFKDEEGMAEYIMATHKSKLIGTTGIFYKTKLKMPKPLCNDCGGKIITLTCWDIEHLRRVAEKNREVFGPTCKPSFSSAPPPAPRDITLDNYMKGGFL